MIGTRAVRRGSPEGEGRGEGRVRNGGQSGTVTDVALARERFLTSGRLDTDSVRDVVQASWRRSRLWGVDVDRAEPPYRDDVDRDSQLVVAAQPVLDRLADELHGARMTVILTDAKAVVLDRRAGEPSLNAYLDSVLLAPGFTYAEKFIGTNGIGTALEEKRPSHVFGHEHFVGSLHTLSCAAAPIHDPFQWGWWRWSSPPCRTRASCGRPTRWRS
jgi:sigma-54 dependent transcriptional regulator, acetoin dehydrogenase operon transcriptional activator AcoR